tara:strand:+ start:6284 stop:6640 length:357 start_codon:yes stop_codon:yes gene_type:complete
MVEKVKVTKHSPFVLTRREALLKFPEDSDYYGLEVRAKLDVDMKTFIQFQRLGSEPDADESQYLFEKFGTDIIVEWNLHDEDARPVPPDADGFMSLPPSICIAMIGAWAENVSAVGEA